MAEINVLLALAFRVQGQSHTAIFLIFATIPLFLRFGLVLVGHKFSLKPFQVSDSMSPSATNVDDRKNSNVLTI